MYFLDLDFDLFYSLILYFDQKNNSYGFSFKIVIKLEPPLKIVILGYLN